MYDIYAFSYDHSTYIKKERLQVFKLVKVSPNQMKGSSIWTFEPPVLEEKTLYLVDIGGVPVQVVNDGGTVRQATWDEITEYRYAQPI